MWYCPVCGAKCRDENRFCEACGTKKPEVNTNNTATGYDVSGQRGNYTGAQSNYAGSRSNYTGQQQYVNTDAGQGKYANTQQYAASNTQQYMVNTAGGRQLYEDNRVNAGARLKKKKHTGLIIGIIAAVIVLAAAACVVLFTGILNKGPESIAILQDGEEVSRITVKAEDDAFELEAKLEPDKAKGEIEWSTSDRDVVKVKDSGDGACTVTPVGEGTAKITASCGDVEETVKITVEAEAAAQPQENNVISNTDGSITGVEDGILTVAMECEFPPYNWTQENDSNGAVPIKDSSLYANGYDVMIAKLICEKNGWELEIVQGAFDELLSMVTSGEADIAIDAIYINEYRKDTVDFAGPYRYDNLVCLTTENSAYAVAGGISDLAGATCTCVYDWFEEYLYQIENVNVIAPGDYLMDMVMELQDGVIDVLCLDMTTAQVVLQDYPELVLLDFFDTGDDFNVSEEDVYVGIPVRKGNYALLNAINDVIFSMSRAELNSLMDEAISIQP